jgi:hypothetical protein
MCTKLSSYLIPILLFLSCSTVNGGVKDQYQVFYIPIGVDYFKPILREDIEKTACKKGTIKSKELDKLFTKLPPCSKAVSDYDIRILVVTGRLKLYIDADSTFSIDGKKCEVAEENKKAIVASIQKEVRNFKNLWSEGSCD